MLLSQIIISAAVESLKTATPPMHEELTVFIRRLSSAYTARGMSGIQSLARMIGGMISSHTSLQHGIFGPGRRLSPTEIKVLEQILNTAVKSASTSVEADEVDGLIFQGLEATLNSAAKAVE